MRYIFLSLLLLAAFVGAGQKRSLSIATYNIRYDNATDAANGNGWKQRLPAIAALIRLHGFDLLGTQEGLAHQLQQLKDSLKGYDYIGVGRDDGRDKGEHSALFYNTARFGLLANGNFWLSEDTAKPNKGWDAVLPRICSWGLFREHQTGFQFYAFNLHLDHVGVIARTQSARLVLEKIRSRAGKTPVVLMGDFNVDQEDEAYTTIHTSGILSDAYTLSPVRWAPCGTFNGFDPLRCTDSRIDHIFLTGGFRALRYGILNNTYNNCLPGTYRDTTAAWQTLRFPSDHFPVMTIVAY